MSRGTESKLRTPTDDVGVVGRDVPLRLTTFEPTQRDLLLYELRQWREVILEAISFAEQGSSSVDERLTGTMADKQAKLAIVVEAIEELEAVAPVDPPVLVGPAWFVQEITRGGVFTHVEELHRVMDDWGSGSAEAESRADLQRGLYLVRIWTRSLLAAFEPPLPAKS